MRRNDDGTWDAWIPLELAEEFKSEGLARRSDHELPPDAGGVDVDTVLQVFGFAANYLTFYESTTMATVVSKVLAWCGRQPNPRPDDYFLRLNGPNGSVIAELANRPDEDAVIAMARACFGDDDRA